jgi:hypothetical protein
LQVQVESLIDALETKNVNSALQFIDSNLGFHFGHFNPNDVGVGSGGGLHLNCALQFIDSNLGFHFGYFNPHDVGVGSGGGVLPYLESYDVGVGGMLDDNLFGVLSYLEYFESCSAMMSKNGGSGAISCTTDFG